MLFTSDVHSNSEANRLSPLHPVESLRRVGSAIAHYMTDEERESRRNTLLQARELAERTGWPLDTTIEFIPEQPKSPSLDQASQDAA